MIGAAGDTNRGVCRRVLVCVLGVTRCVRKAEAVRGPTLSSHHEPDASEKSANTLTGESVLCTECK